MSYPKLTPIIAKEATEPRYLEDRFVDILTPLDFGAKGDGITDDTSAFSALEEAYSGVYVNCLGKTYVVSEIKTGAKYFNGFFKVNTTDYPVEYNIPRAGCFGIAIGVSAGNSINPTKSNADLVAIGDDAAKNVTFARNCIAIGRKALSGPAPGRHNISIGAESLAFVESSGPNDMNGSRNICIGGNSGHFITEGNRNIIIGRDAGHSITTGGMNVIIGGGSMVGSCPNTPVPNVVDNQAPSTGYGNVVVGVGSASNIKDGGYNTIIGTNTANNIKDSFGLIVIGKDAGNLLDSGVSPFGTQQTLVNITGSYSQSGTNITVTTQSNHGLVQNGYVRIRFTSGEVATNSAEDDIWFIVSSVTSSTEFIISQYPTTSGLKTVPSMEASGNVRVSATANATTIDSTTNNSTIIGTNACSQSTSATNVTIVGTNSGKKATTNTVLVGSNVGISLTGGETTIVGTASGYALTSGQGNTVLGANSLSGTTTGSYNVAVGLGALQKNTDGEWFNYNRCAGLGAYTRCSGDYQVQLGASDQTPYSYAQLQVRSDSRDKEDIRDTILGLDFLLSLRPVDFKWDYRDDYIEINDDGETIHHEKNGSHKRNRYHHGLIAQEVKAVLDEKGIDFGGYQDHKINGGNDVLTLGYEEFIGPLIKSIQELNTKIEQLTEQVNQLTNNNE